jgi:single-stranded-DNA-specific exonuclease
VEPLLRHAARRSRITVHGDYDVDGICSTAILVRSLRRLGADVDWFLPSRADDGYGLTDATVHRLRDRGTRLLVTVDCGITAVEQVAAARAAGMDVVVTDHHSPRADGRLPAAPIVHPVTGGYPCPDLCAAGVAHKLAAALEAAAGIPGPGADEDLDLVGLATVADCVPLRGENRRLVRAGLQALARTGKPGLRALMRVAQVDPAGVDAHALGFRLGPRINAAGRLHRADAGLELVMTEDEARAEEIALELDAANAERRDVETRMLFEAEAQAGQAGPRVTLVLAAEGWHPGVVGIVASRIAERHHRPAVLIALDGEHGKGSARSIPAFDLLGGLAAAGDHLERFGGHRAAAGLELRREALTAFRAAFELHAASTLTPHDLVASERVDAVVPGDALELGLAEELARLAPFGTGNPAPNLLVPAATLTDPRSVGEGKHVRFSVQGGGARSRAVAFGQTASGLPTDRPVDATFRLEVGAWNGAVEPKLVLGGARECAGAAIEILGEPTGHLDAALAELDAPLEPWPPPAAQGGPREPVDRRGRGIAGTLGDLVLAGEPVLVVCADAPARRRGLEGRLGGFALCSWATLERAPELAAGFVHLLALDPPAHAHQRALLEGCGPARGHAWAHLAWGTPELRFARRIHEHEHHLRPSLQALYRVLRERDGAAGADLEPLLHRPDGAAALSARAAGRCLRVLEELELVAVDRRGRGVSVLPVRRTQLERSPAQRAFLARGEDGLRWLSAREAARAA